MFCCLTLLLRASARRRVGGARLLAAALLRRLSRARHELPVDDRVRVPLPFEARPADSRVDCVRGGLLGVVVADVARLAVRVSVLRLPPSLSGSAKLLILKTGNRCREFPVNLRQACDTQNAFPCRAKSLRQKIAAGVPKPVFFSMRRRDAHVDSKPSYTDQF